MPFKDHFKGAQFISESALQPDKSTTLNCLRWCNNNVESIPQVCEYFSSFSKTSILLMKTFTSSEVSIRYDQFPVLATAEIVLS